MGVWGCGATQVVTVSFARSTFTRRPLAELQMKMAPPSEPEHTKSLRSPMSETCKAAILFQGVHQKQGSPLPRHDVKQQSGLALAKSSCVRLTLLV